MVRERWQVRDINDCDTVIVGGEIEIGVLNIHEVFNPREVLDSEAAHFADLGLDYLETRDYDMARTAFGRSLESAFAEPELHYYYALALLGERRPRRLHRDDADAIEGRLRQAIRRRPAPHARLLFAFFKHEFYRRNGLREKQPTPERLLEDVRLSGISLSRLKELLRHTTIGSFIREGSVQP